MLTKDLLGNWLLEKGYTKDEFGHYTRTTVNETHLEGDSVTTRFKLQSNSVRYEKQVKIVDHNEWVRLASGYYKNLSITPEGKLAGMKR